MNPVYLLQSLAASRSVVGGAFAVLMCAFTMWMLVDCIQNRRDYWWFWIIMGTGGLGAFYYFYTFLWESDLMHNLLWNSFTERRRIKELKHRARHFNRAVNHEELGDAYMRIRKYPEAEQCYRTALERDPKAFDARVQLGTVLFLQGRADDAWEYLHAAYEERPDYAEDQLLWQCARCQSARGEYEEAGHLYEYLLARHSYYEAQVEFAEVLLKGPHPERGVDLLHEIIEDHDCSPRYVQRREGRWARKAKRLLRSAPARQAVGV